MNLLKNNYYIQYSIRSNFQMTKFAKTIHWLILRKDMFENWWKSF